MLLCPSQTWKMHLFSITAHILAGTKWEKCVPQLRIETLWDLLLYKISWGCLFHFICAAVLPTVLLCARVCDSFGPDIYFWVCWTSACTSLMGKERMAKVHITVTLLQTWQRLSEPSSICFYLLQHSRLCSFYSALRLPVPSVLPPIPPRCLTEVISLPPLPLVSSSVSLLLISVIPSILFTFCFTPFFPFIFQLLSRVHCFCLLASPSSFFISSRKTAFLLPSSYLIRVSLQRSVKWWNTSGQPCHSLGFFPPDIRMFHQRPEAPKLSRCQTSNTPTHSQASSFFPKQQSFENGLLLFQRPLRMYEFGKHS